MHAYIHEITSDKIYCFYHPPPNYESGTCKTSELYTYWLSWASRTGEFWYPFFPGKNYVCWHKSLQIQLTYCLNKTDSFKSFGLSDLCLF